MEKRDPGYDRIRGIKLGDLLLTALLWIAAYVIWTQEPGMHVAAASCAAFGPLYLLYQWSRR